jgi:N utilization substance protein A
MLPDLNRVIEQVSKEKGIDRQIIVEALEQAMLSAAKRTFGPDKNIEAKFNPEVGEVELFEIKRVVTEIEDVENDVLLGDARKNLDPEAQVGDELLAKLPAEKFGRSACATPSATASTRSSGRGRGSSRPGRCSASRRRI